MVDNLSKLLTVSQAAKRSPLSEPQIRSRINSGELSAIRLAGGVFIDADTLDAYLKHLQVA